MPHSRLRTPLEIRLLVALALLGTLPACTGSDRPTAPVHEPVASIALRGEDTTRLGDGYRVAASARDAAGRPLQGRPLEYASRTPELAEVDSVGGVRAFAPGVAVLAVSSEGASAEMRLVIRPARVAVVRFGATAPTELNRGDTVTVTPAIIDRLGDSVTRPVTYASSAPTVATVDSTGRVIALAVGMATISATVEGVSGSYAVTVVHFPAPASVVVRPATAALLEGSGGRLWVDATDADGRRVTPARVSFTSSDTTVAIVDAIGRLTARAPGSAAVTTTVNGRSTTTTVRVDPRDAGQYRIEFVFVGLLAQDPALQSIAREAAARWERVIVGALAPQAVDFQPGRCARGTPAISATTTGMIVVVMTDSLPPGVVGYGGPCGLRDAPPGEWRALGAPAVGVVTLDSARLRSYLNGNHTFARDLLTHEIGHALGIGVLWRRFGNATDEMRVGPDTDYHFEGANAMAASAELGFTAPGAAVPLENEGGAGTVGAHLRRSVYGPEVMNGWLSSGGQPLTAVTAGLLRDLGYPVQMAGADLVTAAELNPSVFGPLSAHSGATGGWNTSRVQGALIKLRERPYDGSMYAIGRDGRPRPIAQR